MKKFERELRKAYGDEWEVSRTGGDHYRLVHRETGMICITASTPSSWRNQRKLRSTTQRLLRKKPH